MGCTARGGDYIQHKKRLLAIAAAGAALALSVVMIVSLSGDDKPTITTNPPPADDQPASTPTTSGGVSVTPDDEDEYGNPHGPGHDNGNQNDDSDDETGSDDGDDETGDDDDEVPPSEDNKTTGLEHAIEVHIRNMERQAEKKGVSLESMMEEGKGLANALEHLQINLEKHQASDDGEETLTTRTMARATAMATPDHS